MLDVTSLVQQMRDTLSEIHDTITSLDTKGHDEKLDALESQRDEFFRQLHSAFEKESAELNQRREAERDEIAEQRRKEDEEIAARRKREDEEKAARNHDQDVGREQKLESEKVGVEQETDVKMDHIEEEARQMLDEGHKKLRDLEERRREINRMIDEQMKAPLPPPPTRRARRGTRASQSGLPDQIERNQPREGGKPSETQPQLEAGTHGSRDQGTEESKPEQVAQADTKQAEPQQESTSPEQASVEDESKSRDHPPDPSAGPVSLHESPSDKPAGHEDQGELQEAVSESQPLSGADKTSSESVTQHGAPAAQQTTAGAEEERSNRAAEQAAAPSEKSEQTRQATTDSVHDDMGNSSGEKSAQDGPAIENLDVKDRSLDSGDTQKDSQVHDADAPMSTPSESQGQPSGADTEQAPSNFEEANLSMERQADHHDQEGLETLEVSDSPRELTGSEVPTTDMSAHEEAPSQSQSQPTNDDLRATERSAEQEEPKSTNNDDLFLGVTKGGAAEEYVKMAEADSDQEPRLGGTSSTLEQHSSSVNDHPVGQQHEESDHGAQQPEPARRGTSTVDQESPRDTSQAQAVEEPSATSGLADSVEHKADPWAESEQERDRLQSREANSSNYDAEASHTEPADGLRDEPTENSEHQLRNDHDQPALGELQDVGASRNMEIGHKEPSAFPQDSPATRDVESPNRDQLHETGLVEHSQSRDVPTESVSQTRDVEVAQDQGAGLNRISADEPSVPEEDVGDAKDHPQPAESEQALHGSEQHDRPLESTHGEQEQPKIDAAVQFEQSELDHQESTNSEQDGSGISSHGGQVGTEPDHNEENADSTFHEQMNESHDESQASKDQTKKIKEEEVARPSPNGTPSIEEPKEIQDTSLEQAQDPEVGDKRSDSGYETGMASSRNLEDSTATLHEAQHEHQSTGGSEPPLAESSPQSHQESPREPRSEQILEGSGKDVSPPRLGGEPQGSDGHPAEETFDLSGSEPIPGTMTHGKDESEFNGKDLASGDVGSRNVSQQQPADDTESGAVTSHPEGIGSIDKTHEKQEMEGSLTQAGSQDSNDGQTQTDHQPIARDVEDTVLDDWSSQEAERQPQLEISETKSQAPTRDAAEAQKQDSQGDIEGNTEPSVTAKPQDQGSAPDDSQVEQSHSVDDVESTMSRGLDEPQQDILVGGDAASIPDSSEHVQEPSQLSQSPATHNFSSDGFGPWSSQTFNGPAHDSEISFKKRADSVQVGQSHGSTDRGAELPFISTEGPHEDPDEGLFAVPPTPRHEADQNKPSQFQGDGESKPTSRASSRDGSSTGADTLSPQAAEGLRDSYRQGSDRELPLGTSVPNEDTHHDVSPGLDNESQASPDVLEMSKGPEERRVRSESHLDESSNHSDLDRGQPDELSTRGTGSVHGQSLAGNDDEQQGQQHAVKSSTNAVKGSIGSERNLNEFVEDETPSSDKHISDSPSMQYSNRDQIGETQDGEDDQPREISGEHDLEPSRSQKKHDLKQEGLDPSKPERQTMDSSNDDNQQEGGHGGLNSLEINNQPVFGQSEAENGEKDSDRIGEDSQVQQVSDGGGNSPESEDSENQTFRNISPEDAKPAGSQDRNDQIANPPQLDQGGTQQLESGHGPEVDELDHGHTDVDQAATHQASPHHSSQYLNAQQANYDGEGYGVTPSSEYSNDPYTDLASREKDDLHPADDTVDTRQPNATPYDLPKSTHVTHGDDQVDSDSETFETPLESADFQKAESDNRAAIPGHFTQALGHLPDESAHTVQGTDDLFDDTDDTEDQDDYGEAVVYQHSNDLADNSRDAEKTVYSTQGDENNTALGGHRSSLSLGSTGHRSQGSISSMRDTTPVRPTFGSYIGGPNVVRADWAAEHEDELRPSSLNPTPQLGPSTTHDTPEISPFALRSTPMPGHAGDAKGLSSSRWNPERPQTPNSGTPHSNNPFATPQRQAQADPGVDLSLFVPRDVTHGRQDSIPASLHSQTTLDSSWSSPVHSSLPVDRHEPVIRDSWPTPAPGYQQYLSSWSSRPRGDTTSTAAEYDPFRPDNGGGDGGHGAAKSSSSYNPFLQRGRAESSVSAAPSNPSVNSSPSRGSALFAKMRNIFENQNSNGGSDAPASPGRTRPVSGVFHPAIPAQKSSQGNLTGQRDDERGGFLNEADHEIDERSAFLRSDGQPSGHNTYNDEH
ncbi:hypothetical protein N8I77_001704 [Diaporthe amygdali]|uniref:Uncharacterized protein n=1 Tax=Phomopsis amygdali TaxID=1214568 RepID=A0AAD9STB8_PHOAM|nr:hypothetical protein N8I77_001704 [Diaporthe amygdali]